MKLASFYVLSAMLGSFLTTHCLGDGNTQEELEKLKKKVQSLQSAVEEVEAEVAILKEGSNLLIRKTTLGFRNAAYLRAGFSLLFPRARTFSFRTDTGLGLFAGAGKYFGRHHVVDASFDWDVYPALTLRYRFEFQNDSPSITFGPLIGYRIKLFDVDPLDNFVDQPTAVDKQFLMFGVILGFPVGKSVLNAELIVLKRNQTIITMNAAVHFYL